MWTKRERVEKTKQTKNIKIKSTYKQTHTDFFFSKIRTSQNTHSSQINLKYNNSLPKKIWTIYLVYCVSTQNSNKINLLMVTLHSTLRYTKTDQVVILNAENQQLDGFDIFITNLSLGTHWLDVYLFLTVKTV